MGKITSSGSARNDRITRDEVECDPVVPGAATRRDPTHQNKLLIRRAVTLQCIAPTYADV